jgi:hypothetical protein
LKSEIPTDTVLAMAYVDDRVQLGPVRVSPEVGEVLRRIARDEDRPVVTVARRALAEWVEQRQREREGAPTVR